VLTADLVGARRRGDELRLAPTDEARRARIAALAAALTARAREEIGNSRDGVEEALRETAAELEAAEAQATQAGQASRAGGDRRLSAAVGKLVKDGLRFEESSAGVATELRRDLFRGAAAARRTAPAAPFDRAAFLEGFARERGTTAGALEAGLYADRPGAQRLLAVETPAPALLAAGFEIAEAQAVLLRATKIVAEIEASDAALYRRLFRSLKFLRLLPVISPVGKRGGYRVEMDGPLSLFQGAGRYGLSLALALPAIAACDAWTIDADVRWGADRRPLRFRLGGRTNAASAALGAAAPDDALPDELATFVAAFARVESGWRIDRAPAILDLPGAGLCVPDLCFVRIGDGARVFLELLGFWSREAVFRRIDLVRAGLPHRILFVASKSLRVGEALLDDAPQAALYVFTRVLNVGAILERLQRLAPK
jgi:predicted nuclease of restriction endonuclease-like RecB superfamily